MLYIAIILGCLIGAILGLNSPVISYTYSSYLSIAIIAALDTVFGGISSVIKGSFELSIALTYLGNKLNVDIYLAAIVVFVGRMFTNLAIIRRYYIDKWSDIMSKKVKDKTTKSQDDDIKDNDQVSIIEEN